MTTEPSLGGKREPALRLLRFIAGVILLFGPLVATELWMRGQAEWLRPVLRRFDVAMDLKLILFEQRGACPDAVSLGTSLADNALPPRYLKGKRVGRRAIEDPFDFAVPEVRATTMLAQYRWMRRRGCVPTWLFVEYTPIAINGKHGGPAHDPAVLELGSLLAMPRGFAELRGYTLATQLELITYDRLLIERRRRQIAERWLEQVDGQSWFLSASEREQAEAAEAKAEAKARAQGKDPDAAKRKQDEAELEWDGKLTALRRGQDDKRWRQEQRRRTKRFADGTYEWHYTEVERAALERLVREAAADGVTVILHSPPVTPLYRELTEQLGMETDFADFASRVDALADELPGVVAYNAHADPRYDWDSFFDWVHLSSRSSRGYIEQLLTSATGDLRAEDEPARTP